MIRVGIRGIGGLLGTRLLRKIALQPDMSVCCGITDDNPTALIALADAQAWGREHHRQLWHQLFFDGSEAQCQMLNTRYGLALAPISQLVLNQTCDILVDTAAPAASEFTSQYPSFRGHVLLQDGAYPQGRAIALPLVAPVVADEPARLFRQGDCLLSGLAPLIHQFRDQLQTVWVPSVLRISSAPAGYLTSARVNSVHISLSSAGRWSQQLTTLTGFSTHVHDVLQVPQIDYYIVSLLLMINQPLSVDAVRARLCHTPRIWLYQGNTESMSTYAIDDQFRLATEQIIGRLQPPIIVFDQLLRSLPASVQFGLPARVELRLAIRHEHITPLSILDSIRYLCCNIPIETAMQQTDAQCLA